MEMWNVATEKNNHKGHRKRLKKRFKENGLDGFELHNALELFLFFSIPQGDTNNIAHNLLDQFGSLSAMFEAPIEALTKVKGVGEHTALMFKLFLEMDRLYHADKNRTMVTINNSADMGKYFLPKFIGRNEEVVFTMCLDNHCRVLGCDIVAKGTIDSAPITIRCIAEAAMKYNCVNVVIAHNHPKGLPLASPEDVITTDAINYALKLLGIHMLDHIIVARERYTSMAESGQITDLWKEEEEKKRKNSGL